MTQGLKVGIEIHQQLNTEKLFCACPSNLRGDQPHFAIKRNLKAVAGELGKVDEAARQEITKNRSFVYEGYFDTNCLVELDEEPPRGLNPEAVEIVLAVAKALKARPVDELQVMRKAIVDGSCVSGFQRTLLVATDGKLTVQGKTIDVPTICLEEDAARIIRQDEREIVYRLDRAGVPLIEIATAPQMASPTEAREVAEKIGLLLRCTGKVMRGLGTIRQDVNVSIPGGRRVEIKGVQKLDLIPVVVENEIKRQEALAELREKFQGARAKVLEVSGIFEQTDCKVLRGKKVFAAKLSGLAGVFKREVGGKRFGKEIADYLRARTNASGFFHTDELPGYGITVEEVAALREKVGATEKDAVVLAAGEARIIETIIERLVQFGDGVPEDTRKANEDGSTSYMRPLPGASRLYPETDVPVFLTKALFEKATAAVEPEKKLKELEELGLSKKLAKGILLSHWADVFDTAVELGVPPTVAATTLEETIPYLRRKGVNTENLDEQQLKEMFETLGKKKLAKEIIPEALTALTRGETLEKFFAADVDVDVVIHEIVREKKDYVAENGERALAGLMGLAMEKLRGKVDGKVIREKLMKEMKGPGEEVSRR